MKLHLGAFDSGIKGWSNTDITPHIWVSKIPALPFVLYKLGLMPKARYEQHVNGVFGMLDYLNLCKPLPYADNTVEAIFSSHVFEHLFMDEVEKLISECHRVLKRGGIYRAVFAGWLCLIWKR